MSRSPTASLSLWWCLLVCGGLLTLSNATASEDGGGDLRTSGSVKRRDLLGAEIELAPKGEGDVDDRKDDGESEKVRDIMEEEGSAESRDGKQFRFPPPPLRQQGNPRRLQPFSDDLGLSGPPGRRFLNGDGNNFAGRFPPPPSRLGGAQGFGRGRERFQPPPPGRSRFPNFDLEDDELETGFKPVLPSGSGRRNDRKKSPRRSSSSSAGKKKKKSEREKIASLLNSDLPGRKIVIALKRPIKDEEEEEDEEKRPGKRGKESQRRPRPPGKLRPSGSSYGYYDYHEWESRKVGLEPLAFIPNIKLDDKNIPRPSRFPQERTTPKSEGGGSSFKPLLPTKRPEYRRPSRAPDSSGPNADQSNSRLHTEYFSLPSAVKPKPPPSPPQRSERRPPAKIPVLVKKLAKRPVDSRRGGVGPVTFPPLKPSRPPKLATEKPKSENSSDHCASSDIDCGVSKRKKKNAKKDLKVGGVEVGEEGEKEARKLLDFLRGEVWVIPVLVSSCALAAVLLVFEIYLISKVSPSS